jgi:indolepyruvate decarboxylase
MLLGDYLVAYLKKIGVSHLFGIPGDLVIGLFFKFGKPQGLKVVTFCHEPGVGFAADGYARSTGRLGVVCVTYGAGGHNMVNPIAASFSEKVPLLVVSGGPGEEERKLGTLIHHQAKEIESQLRIYQEITCAQRVIVDPMRAAEEIDELIHAIWENRRPGYLEIHRDMVDREILVPKRIVEWDGALTFRHSDKRKVQEAVRETSERYNHAVKPLLIVGIESYRFNLERDMVRLVEKMGVPCCTSVLAKGAFPMDHPLYMGVYMGGFSPQRIRHRVDGADLVLNLGTLRTDMDLAGEPGQPAREGSIWALENRVEVSYHAYTDVGLYDYVKELGKAELKHHRERVVYSDHLGFRTFQPTKTLRVADLLAEVNRFLETRKNIAVVAESGDALFGGLDIKVHGGGLYLAQGYYASMGFAVPGALGAQIGTGMRPLVLCGDGGFQMTGQEISHAPRHGLNPIVIVLNNQGWGIFRPIAKREELLTIPLWSYRDLARCWGGVGFRAETLGELRFALQESAGLKSFVLIEAMIGPRDLSPVTLKYIRASAKKAHLEKPHENLHRSN